MTRLILRGTIAFLLIASQISGTAQSPQQNKKTTQPDQPSGCNFTEKTSAELCKATRPRDWPFKVTFSVDLSKFLTTYLPSGKFEVSNSTSSISDFNKAVKHRIYFSCLLKNLLGYNPAQIDYTMNLQLLTTGAQPLSGANLASWLDKHPFPSCNTPPNPRYRIQFFTTGNMQPLNLVARHFTASSQTRAYLTP